MPKKVMISGATVRSMNRRTELWSKATIFFNSELHGKRED
jgi:hypothetical protein